MSKILSFLEKATSAYSYQSSRYCFENNQTTIKNNDDKQDIVISDDKMGETDSGLKTTKSLSDKVKRHHGEESLFKYFLDGSRRTYCVDDLAYDKKLYPVIAGQIGVGCCVRESLDSFKSCSFERQLVFSLPLPSCSDSENENSFGHKLTTKLNQLDFLQRNNIYFDKIFIYRTKLKQGECYEHKGIAKIQDEMIECEKRLVDKLVRENRLNNTTYLLKDGSLQYVDTKRADSKDLARIRHNYQRIVGVSKSFNPELFTDKKGKSIAREIANLPYMNRTPAYKYSVDRIPDVEFSIWYVRIREAKYTASPFDGVIKVEKVLITEAEREEGLSSDEIDLISINLINERNPTCYGVDNRWANHLYPVFLTESFIKSQFLSDSYFLNLF
jgi:hypothetical protein